LTNPYIKGFNDQPDPDAQGRIANHEEFGRKLLAAIPDWPVLEVFADDLPSMLAQGKAIALVGRPSQCQDSVTTTSGIFTGPVIAQQYVNEERPNTYELLPKTPKPQTLN
jgi:hypothetical protein